MDKKNSYEGQLDEDDFPELDSLIDFIRAFPEDNRTRISDPIRLAQMRFSCQSLEKILNNNKIVAKITYGQGKVDKSMGFAEVEMKSLEIANTDLFAQMAKFADSVEIYPLVKNKFRIAIGFRKLYIPI